MIIVHGTFPVKAETRSEAISLMKRMSDESRREYGCISYEFYVGLSDPNTLLLFQEWESVEALQEHFRTDHMEEFLKALPDVLDGEVSTRRYEVRASTDDFDEPHGEFDPEYSDPELSDSEYTYHEKIIH